MKGARFELGFTGKNILFYLLFIGLRKNKNILVINSYSI
jgi:hypothetical protein